METYLGDTEESTEDSPGHKKSRLKSLKTRLFGKSKKSGQASTRKLCQSESDITAGEGLGSDEDLVCTQGIMGSRALSHDSIFSADQALTEPVRVLSQENVHSKIKALQEKLQQQKGKGIHLGIPPMVVPIKRPEDQSCQSEDDAHNRSEMSEEAFNTALPQLSSQPMLPSPKTALTKPVPPLLPATPKPTSPTDELPLDFSSPAQFTPSLDTSAARHRLSVKPRNQRASTKKRLFTVDSTSLIPDLNNIETLKEEDGQPEEEEVEVGRIPETPPVPSVPTNPETTSKSSSFVPPHQDTAILGKMPTVTSQILRPKPHKSADVMPPVRPHSSFIPSEVKGKSERFDKFDIQFLRDTQNKTTDLKSKMASSDQQSTGPGSVLRPIVVHSETHSISEIKRPVPGSGSFHLSISATKRKEEEERPRSGSFTGVREHTGAWVKTGDLKPSGGPIDVGRLRQETAQHKGETKDSLRKVESVRQPKNKITDTGDSEEAVKEVEEEEAKTTFGIKLRSTSQSVRLRAEVASHEKSAGTEEKQQKQEISNNANQMSKKTPVDASWTASITGEAKPTDVSTAPSVVNAPAKQTPQSPVNTLVSTEGQSASSDSTQVKAASQGLQPHATSTEVSWMSMAMEKTRSLQNLFSSKLSRDFTGAQTAARSQKTQVQTRTQAQADTQTPNVKRTNQLPSDAIKTETLQNKPLPLTPAQQKTPNTSPSEEAQISKPAEPQLTLTESIPHSVTQPVAQSNIWTNQSPLRSIRQVESTSQSAPGSPAQTGLPLSQSATSQQPLWSTRSLRSTGLVSTVSSQDTAADSENGVANVQEREGQPVCAESVIKKTAYLERRAEWTTSPVKMIKTVTPSETSAQSPSESKDAESSPKKNPEMPRDEKWLCKTAAPSSFLTPSSTVSSSLQSVSDSGQPSWMEMAKRKSRAWSDKTMD